MAIGVGGVGASVGPLVGEALRNGGSWEFTNSRFAAADNGLFLIISFLAKQISFKFIIETP